MVNEAIKKLITYGLEHQMIEEGDVDFVRNQILEALELDEYEEPEETYSQVELAPVLNELLDDAASRGVMEQDTVTYRDLLDTKVMGKMVPWPSQVNRTFWELYKESPKKATDYFYQLSQDSNYIRRDRIARDEKWEAQTAYGDMEITINLSKPEKDPRDIAAARNAASSSYPKCLLCKENEGYAGRVNHPARQNHRIIALTLQGEEWGLQYSPYVYYNEHCIVLNKKHIPMKINGTTFRRLLEFAGKFPHYFLGSNADLPIVGGSILSHDHFQGGNHRFPMDEAGVWIALKEPRAGVSACVADWPMSCVRLESASREDLIALADDMLAAWRKWSDPACDIYAETDQPHNTITPILRMENGKYLLSLVLRNNRTSKEHPLGIFHPHAELHHIKKENIGLIEVMGLFILPGRLKKELADVERALVEGTPVAEAHAAWTEELRAQPGAKEDPAGTVRRGLGKKCARVLADAGVYKHDENGRAGFVRFLESIGYQEA